MGKIRVTAIGDEEAKKKKKQKREEKKKVHLSGMGGGQRVTMVGPTEAELEKLEEKTTESQEGKVEKKAKKVKFQKSKHSRSKKYQGLIVSIDKSKTYPINEALELLEKLQRKTFDETVELHLNTSDPKVSGQTTLPHGTGKKIRVAIASDNLITEIEVGKVNFDILLATPSMMPKLAKVAKVLGPRGLMPNPKNGTIIQNPEEAAKKYEGGLIFFKTEAKAPLLHISVGKMSFGQKKLSDNIETILNAIQKENITKAILKSTQSPSIKVAVDK